MKDIPLTEPLAVTLRAGDWLWLLGLLSALADAGQVDVLDKLYAQILNQVE